MKPTGSKSLPLTLFLIFLSLTGWSGPPRSGNDPVKTHGRKFPSGAFLWGRVLLNSGNFVVGLVGSPAPPQIGPFGASLRIYERRTHEFVEAVTTDIQGRFEINLEPGEYRIVPDIMQENRVVAPGDAQGIVLIGTYEAAPAFVISLKRNQALAVTIVYEMHRGS
jgi:hypothetical protein